MSSQSTPPPKPRRFFSRRLVFGCCLTPVVLLGVVSVGVGIWWLVWNYQLNQRLAAEIQAVRDRGEPLTTVELNDYYQPAPGRPDMTKEILAALKSSQASDLNEQAARLPFVGHPEDYGFPEEVPPATETWAQLAEVEAYLDKQRVALATFHEVARRNGAVRFISDFSTGYNTDLMHMVGMRHAARILSLEFHVHLHRGRPSQAVDSLIAKFKWAQILDGEPTMISQLVRTAIGRMAIEEMQRGVREVTFSDADCARLQSALRDFQFEFGLIQALIGERACAYTACLDVAMLPDEKSTTTPEAIREICTRAPQRVMDAAKILEVHRRMIESAEDSLSDSLRTSKALQSEFDAMQKSPVTPLMYINTLLLVPAETYAAQTYADTSARRDAADAAIAAELYRQRHGKWPEKLEQLVPEFLPHIPHDPFANAPQQMKVSPEGLRVYSIGNDDQDNQGNLVERMTPGGDIGFEVLVPKRQ